jgi:thiamine-monophosphate kinase
MTGESDFIASLRGLATSEAARSLLDDAAVLDPPAGKLVITHDMLAEGVHFRSDDPPDDVAWKLVAVNLSDLAGKGARPIGVLLGYSLAGTDWDQAFVGGLGTALRAFALPLLGGDTIALPPGAPRVLGLTAIGVADGIVPSRGGARPGDQLWVSGTIGDAGAGLELLEAGKQEPAGLVERYRNPRPRLEAGQRLAPLVSAMMDVSDGLLIDARRMAEASGCRADIALDAVPLSDDRLAFAGTGQAARIDAASAGDDYELLFAAPATAATQILAIGDEIGLPLTPVGGFSEGAGIALNDAGEPVALPDRLGYEHRRGD